MYDFPARKGPVNARAILLAIAMHLMLIGMFWVIGCINIRHEEVVIPIDMTVVPPWAVQTDDPEPDPNPPPKVETPKPRPKPEPVVEKTPEPKVEAVEKIVEKPKPKPDKPKPPEKIDLRKEAKFVKTPVEQPKPVDLRAQATKVEPPPMVKTTGKGTAADKPMSREEFDRLMNQGYRIGPRNQLATGEEQRCISLIVAAIRRECDKDNFKWHDGLKPVQLNLSFGSGGRITGCRLTGSCGDGSIDSLVVRAVNRLGSVGGLSATFLEKYPVVPAVIELLQR